MGYDANRAIAKARAVVKKYGTDDPWKLANRLPGVKVVFEDLGDNILGYTLVACRQAVITLGTALPSAVATSTLTHEVGHAILTRDTSTNYFYKNAGVAAVGSSEYIANCFMFQVLFGDRGPINPMNYEHILLAYGLPTWMGQYFSLIK